MHKLKKFDLTKFIKKHRFFFLFLVINIIAHWKILLLDTQLAYGDFLPFPENPLQPLKSFLFSWQEAGFGIYRQSANTTFLILSGMLFLLRSPILAQKFYIFLLSTLSYLTFSKFLKKDVKIKSDVSVFFSSLFYTFSPIALGEFTGGSQFSTMLVFSVMPFVYSNTLSLLKKSTLKKIVVHGLLIGVLFSIYTQFIALYFLSLIFLFIFDIFRTKFRAFRRWWNLVYTGIIAILFNPIVVITTSNILINTDTGEEARSFVDSSAQFLMEMSITYNKNPLTTIFRLGSLGALDYRADNFWTIPFFLTVLFTILTVAYFQFKKSKPDRLVIVSLVYYLGISLFIFGTAKQWTFPIFRAIPILFMFRNPAKLTYLSTFFFSILYAYSLQKFVNTKFDKKIKIITVSILLLIQLTYTWALFLGDRGLSAQRERFMIPQDYYQIVSKINSLRQDPTARTSWIPIGHEATFIKLAWLDTNKLDAQIGIQEFGGAAFERTVLESVYFAFFRQDQNAALKALRMAQVDYLAIFTDSYFYNRSIFNPDIIKKTLEGLPLVFTNDTFELYEIGTNFPLIFSPSKIYTSNVQDSFYSLSKIKTGELFALVPLESIRQTQILPDDFFLFVSHKTTPHLVTNTMWRETWSWKKPAVFPKKPAQLTPETDLYQHTITSLESLAETTNYLTQTDNLNVSERNSLLGNYSSIIQFFNLFLTNIPPEQVNSNLLSLVTRIYLYVDRAHLELEQAGLIDQNLQEQYQTFAANVSRYISQPCEYDYCFSIGIRNPTLYEMQIFDVSKDNRDGSLWLDGTEHAFEGFVDNNWVSAGTAQFDEGQHNMWMNLDVPKGRYDFDDNDNQITLYNDEKIKFNFTFLYDFEEDVFFDIYNIPNDADEITDKYLVWKGHLASSDSNNFCYLQEKGKCYRIFVANLQPNNNYETIRVRFYEDVSTDESAKNVIKSITFEEQLLPVIFLKDPSIESPPKNPPNITYKKVNPTKYDIYIENITEDFLLVFNQSFNNNWTLRTQDNVPISTDTHFKSNFYANTWLVKRSEIDNAESVTLEIVFEPQKQIYLSLAVSIITISLSLYLIFRKEPKPKN